MAKLATQYSVFDLNGICVTGQLFSSKDNAEAFALTADLVAEFGPCHAGVPCNEHDELEHGLCYHCAPVKLAIYTVMLWDHSLCHVWAKDASEALLNVWPPAFSRAVAPYGFNL